jgi:mono/diheme cytochrome c family protein
MAVARYLKSLAPGPQTFAPPPYHTQDQQEWPGAGLFAQDCAGCHGDEGQGKDAPALAGNPAVMSQDPSSVIHMILKGGHTPQTGQNAQIMPGFETRLTDQEVARVATYVRQGWGNRAPAVTADKARAIRAHIRDEPMWVTPPRSGAASSR